MLFFLYLTHLILMDLKQYNDLKMYVTPTKIFNLNFIILSYIS